MKSTVVTKAFVIGHLIPDHFVNVMDVIRTFHLTAYCTSFRSLLNTRQILISIERTEKTKCV